MRTRPLPSLLLAAALSTPCAGCYTTWDIPVKEVDRLHGYRAPGERRVIDKEGEQVPVDADTELRFHANDAVPDLRAQFTAINVHDGPEAWLLDGVLHGDGQAIRVDLAQVTSLKARRYSPSKTAAAILVPTLTVVVVLGVLTGIFVASGGFSYGD